MGSLVASKKGQLQRNKSGLQTHPRSSRSRGSEAVRNELSEGGKGCHVAMSCFDPRDLRGRRFH